MFSFDINDISSLLNKTVGVVLFCGEYIIQQHSIHSSISLYILVVCVYVRFSCVCATVL